MVEYTAETWVHPITALVTYTAPAQTLMDHDLEVEVPDTTHNIFNLIVPHDLETTTPENHLFQHLTSALVTYTPETWTHPTTDLVTYTAPAQTLMDHDLEVETVDIAHREFLLANDIDLEVYTVIEQHYYHISELFESAGGGFPVRIGGIVPQPFF